MFIPVSCQTLVMGAISVQSLNEYFCMNRVRLSVKATFLHSNPQHFVDQAIELSLTFQFKILKLLVAGRQLYQRVQVMPIIVFK